MAGVLLCVMLSLASCGKSSVNWSGKGSDAGETTIVDPAILATWEVVKYEAFNRQSILIKSTENSDEIRSGYWKFRFANDSESLMEIWYGPSLATPSMSVWFAYDNGSKLLYFGDYGQADIRTINDSDLVFDSNSFGPAAWFENVEGNADISFVRATCRKVQEASPASGS